MNPEDALEIVLNHLEECAIPYMITGSFASNIHGVPRVTHDADIVIKTDLPNLIRFIDKLGDDFYADSETAREEFAGNRMFNIIHLPTGFKIDLIFRKKRSFSKEEFLRRQKNQFLGQFRWFTTAEDIILAKLEWAKMSESERQFSDAVNVAKIHCKTIDHRYLLRWARELSVEKLLQKLFSELDLKGESNFSQ